MTGLLLVFALVFVLMALAVVVGCWRILHDGKQSLKDADGDR